jgi:hypothetical protein
MIDDNQLFAALFQRRRWPSHALRERSTTCQDGKTSGWTEAQSQIRVQRRTSQTNSTHGQQDAALPVRYGMYSAGGDNGSPMFDYYCWPGDVGYAYIYGIISPSDNNNITIFQCVSYIQQELGFGHYGW